jgi:hypothetical protein
MSPQILREKKHNISRSNLPIKSNNQAFVIHSSHDVITLFYAKLPNEYLAAIVQYGRSYKPSTLSSIKLRQSGKFHLRNSMERQAIFELLAKLFWYLQSGRAHVGFLFNQPDNPIHVYLSNILTLDTLSGRITSAVEANCASCDGE